MIDPAELPYYAETLDDLQKRIIKLCSAGNSFFYSRIAEMLGVEFDEVASAGRMLQGSELALVSHVRHGSEFAGSALFLTPKAEEVRELLLQPEGVSQ
ncbi:hypothetical protein [Altererythrobacter sp. GH1-8]|uniref:hypothetical protein n=1 Tax=Altererythrobacter sp. GH1-8 TaxID=3349333 RepID=UPI00374D314C